LEPATRSDLETRLEAPSEDRADGFLTFVGPVRFAAVFAMVRV